MPHHPHYEELLRDDPGRIRPGCGIDTRVTGEWNRPLGSHRTESCSNIMGRLWDDTMVVRLYYGLFPHIQLRSILVLTAVALELSAARMLRVSCELSIFRKRNSLRRFIVGMSALRIGKKGQTKQRKRTRKIVGL